LLGAAAPTLVHGLPLPLTSAKDDFLAGFTDDLRVRELM
jgi:hypothetical protein